MTPPCVSRRARDLHSLDPTDPRIRWHSIHSLGPLPACIVSVSLAAHVSEPQLAHVHARASIQALLLTACTCSPRARLARRAAVMWRRIVGRAKDYAQRGARVAASLRQPSVRGTHARRVETCPLGWLASVKYVRPPSERTLFSFDSQQELARWKARRSRGCANAATLVAHARVQTFSDAEYGGMSTAALALAPSGALSLQLLPGARRS